MVIVSVYQVHSAAILIAAPNYSFIKIAWRNVLQFFSELPYHILNVG